MYGLAMLCQCESRRALLPKAHVSEHARCIKANTQVPLLILHTDYSQIYHSSSSRSYGTSCTRVAREGQEDLSGRPSHCSKGSSKGELLGRKS